MPRSARVGGGPGWLPTLMVSRPGSEPSGRHPRCRRDSREKPRCDDQQVACASPGVPGRDGPRSR